MNTSIHYIATLAISGLAFGCHGLVDDSENVPNAEALAVLEVTDCTGTQWNLEVLAHEMTQDGTRHTIRTRDQIVDVHVYGSTHDPLLEVTDRQGASLLLLGRMDDGSIYLTSDRGFTLYSTTGALPMTDDDIIRRFVGSRPRGDGRNLL